MARYELNDGKSSKFWEIELHGDSFTTRFGRIGSDGQESIKTFPDEATAKKEHDKLVASKVRKGYQPATEAAPPAPTKPAATDNPELEAALHANPEDTEAWHVYGDWLQSNGHPAGEIIALENAMEDASSKVERAALSNKIEKLIETHQGSWLTKELIAGLEGEDGQPVVELQWKHGFIWSAKARNVYDWEGATVEQLLKAILKSPAARFLYEVRVGITDVEDGDAQFQREILALAKGGKRPSVRRVVIGDFELQDEMEISWTTIGNVEKLYPVFPNLETLEIQGGGIELGALKHATMKKLAIRTGGLPATAARSLGKAQLPNLEVLDVWFGEEDYGGEVTVDLLEPLVNSKSLPRLKHLGLKNAEFSDDLPELLAESSLLPQLTTLDLGMGTMAEVGARQLIERADAFRHLTALKLDENAIDGELVEALTEIYADRLSTVGQKDADDLYVSVGE